MSDVSDMTPGAGARGPGRSRTVVAQDSVRSWRAGFGATLALAMGIPPVVLYALNALSPLVLADLGLSRTAFGVLGSLAFAVAVPCSLWVGRVADRLGGRRMLFTSFAAATIALLLVVSAHAFWWLLAGAVASGFSQSMSNPATNQLVSVHIPPGRQGMLMGFKQSGVQMSQFFTGVTLPPLSVLLGWRGAAIALIIPTLAALALTHRFVPHHQHEPPQPSPPGAEGGRGAFAWWLCAYLFMIGVAIQAANTYLPLYAYEVLGMPAAVAGSLSGLVGAVGIAGRMWWGRVGDRSPDPGRLLTALAVAAVVAFAVIAVASSLGGPVLLAGVVAYAATAASANVVVMLAVVAKVARGAAGSVTGILAIGLYAGFGLGPAAFGALVDATGSYQLGWLTAAAFCAGAAVAAIGWRSTAAPAVAGGAR